MNDRQDFLDGVPAPVPARAGNGQRGRVTLRRAAGVLVISAVVAGCIGYQVGHATAAAPSVAPPVSAPGSGDLTPGSGVTGESVTPSHASSPATPDAPVATPTGGDIGDSLALLTTIPVKGRAPGTGYDREGNFGEPWIDVDGNGCRTRDDILQRDLEDIAIRPETSGCVVTSGTLHDPYTGSTVDFVRGQDTSAMVQIDHVVALYDAWQKGAQQWSQEKRVEFANDPRNLLAVAGSANQNKGAGDAATWLPPNRGYWCEYARRIVAVKATYGVWVTSAEKTRLVQILEECR